MVHGIDLAFAVLCVLNLIDAATTYYIIKSGVGHEANAIMAKLISWLGLGAGLALPKLAVLVALYIVAPPAWALIGLVVLYTGVVINNVLVIQRSKHG